MPAPSPLLRDACEAGGGGGSEGGGVSCACAVAPTPRAAAATNDMISFLVRFIRHLVCLWISMNYFARLTATSNPVQLSRQLLGGREMLGHITDSRADLPSNRRRVTRL